MYGVSLRTRLTDLESSLSQSDRKSSDATVVHKPSIAIDASTPRESMGFVVPVATKENEWLGFCPSAVKLQNGDKKGALRKRTDYAASFAAAGMTTYYCSHKGCLFAGHTSVDFAFKTVMRDERLGVKCRWPFLAKSHVFQKSVPGRQYQFQCPICIFSQGHAEGRTWRGIEIFMEHVSTHRGKELNPEVVQKLHIINDRSADDREDFDINLIPPPKKTYSSSRESVNSTVTSGPPASITPPSLSRAQTFSSFADSIWSRKTSTANLDQHLSGGGGGKYGGLFRGGRSDSVFSTVTEVDPGPADVCSGCWSEGLSEFKMDREEDYLSPDF